MDKVINEIKKHIQWYDSVGGQASIEDLLLYKDKLAVNSFYLAELAASAKTDYNKAYFLRKINVSKSKQGYVAARMAVNKAEIYASVDTELMAKDELEKEAIAYKCDLLIKQMNVIISAMQQRISFLRKEQELTERIGI